MMKKVILVNTQDKVIGESEKLAAHQQGLLHRAFSVFIYRKQAGRCEILLQQRHPQKYHSGGLWTNTCCSHPSPGETILAAAKRRLQEETGIQVALQEIGVFHYRAKVGNDLIENEIDHVLMGEITDLPITVNADEISEIAWVEINELHRQIAHSPGRYTAWLAQALAIFSKHA